MSRRSIRGKAYKKTTSRQYNVMIRDIGRHLSDNGSAKTKGEHYLFWCELRDKLNAVGPPTRNITEWKKVWNDCQRSRKRRELFRMSLKQPKNEPVEEIKIDEEVEENEEETSYNDEDDFHNESSQQSLETEMNFDETNSSFTIYTPSEPVQQRPNNDILIPTQLPPLYRCPTFPNYSATFPEPQRQLRPNVSMLTSDTSNNSHLNQEILCTMKNQMENQSKILEHVSQLSANLAALMERQVVAIERQTVAVRRQAIAMEHHTLVMNSFVDMIRDKMPKNNNTKTADVSNGKL